MVWYAFIFRDKLAHLYIFIGIPLAEEEEDGLTTSRQTHVYDNMAAATLASSAVHRTPPEVQATPKLINVRFVNQWNIRSNADRLINVEITAVPN